MKLLLAIILIFSSVVAMAGQSETLSSIVQLEGQISAKVRGIVQPVDQDAIIYTRIKISTVETALPGTGFGGFSMMATEDVEKVSEQDIESINVNVLTSLDEFPKDIYQVVNQAIKSVSPKAKLTVKKVDAQTLNAIHNKRKEAEKVKTAELAHLEKISQMDESFGKKLEGYGPVIYQSLQLGLLVLLGGFTVIMIMITMIRAKTQSSAIRTLAQSINEIKFSGDLGGGTMMAGAGAVAGGGSADSSEKSSQRVADVLPETNLFESMSIESLRALFSDAYWCGHDRYASYLWNQLTNDKQRSLFESWNGFESYVVYLNRIEPEVEWYHLDPHYLKPLGYHQISNEDMLKIVRASKSVWGSLSIMRRQAMKVSLEERMNLMKYSQAKYVVGWPDVRSEFRKFPSHLEITSLTPEYEEELLSNPDILPKEFRKQLPSLVWLYLCSVEDREKILQNITAPALAEAWSAPQDVLEAILAALPDKKRELVLDYQKTITPNRSSKWIKVISEASLVAMDKAEADRLAEIAAMEAKIAQEQAEQQKLISEDAINVGQTSFTSESHVDGQVSSEDSLSNVTELNAAPEVLGEFASEISEAAEDHKKSNDEGGENPAA